MPDAPSGPSDRQPLFDAHSDLLSVVVRERAAGRDRVVAEAFLPGMAAGGIAARVAAIFVDDEYLPEGALRRGLDAAVALRREVEATDELALATTAGDLEAVGGPADRRPPDGAAHTLVMGMEGAEPLRGDLAVLEAFHRLGLRVLTLTHSRRNAAGDGSFYEPTRSGRPGGLSPFGVELVERCEALGVVVDVSHLNVPGFRDAVEVADGPVLASHSNCRALCDHPRNLTDEQLGAVADTGGVVGVMAIADFVAADDPTLEDVLDHVEHAVEVAGVEHVGFGFDFFEYLAPYRSGWDADDPPFGGTAAGLEDDAAVGALPAALRERGFAADEVAALCFENLRRVFESVLPEG